MNTSENTQTQTEPPFGPPQDGKRPREVAPHVPLPQPGARRFPVGIVLIVLWVAVFLVIFIVLANLKQNPPNRQGPVLPNESQAAPADANAPDDAITTPPTE